MMSCNSNNVNSNVNSNVNNNANINNANSSQNTANQPCNHVKWQNERARMANGPIDYAEFERMVASFGPYPDLERPKGAEEETASGQVEEVVAPAQAIAAEEACSEEGPA